MSSQNSNYGVQISGSAQVSAGSIAGGPGATASAGDVELSAPAADLTELRELLAALAEQLREPPPGVADPDALGTIVASAQQEAAKNRPNMPLLKGLLQALMAGAGNVTSLTTAISAVQHVISNFR
jgi:hypothetical protein